MPVVDPASVERMLADVTETEPLRAATVRVRRVDGGYDIKISGNINEDAMRRSVRAELRRMDRARRDLPDPEPGQVADLLHLVTVMNDKRARPMALAEITKWTPDQRAAAARWALAEHAYIFHNRDELRLARLPWVHALELAFGALPERGES